LKFWPSASGRLLPVGLVILVRFEWPLLAKVDIAGNYFAATKQKQNVCFRPKADIY
jgi:hypothetical protein